MDKFSRFAKIAETEFLDLVIGAQDLGHKLRIYLKDKSFIDFFYSTQSIDLKFAIHWERTHLDSKIYRIDNTPDKKWKKVKTYPVHFHNKRYENVTIPPFEFDVSLEEILRNFLKFSRTMLLAN